MFLFFIQLFLFLLNISPSLCSEYLCPIEAYSWHFYDNQSQLLYQWIYDPTTEQFNRDISRINHGEHSDVICSDIHQRMYEAILIHKKHFQLNWICHYPTNEGEIQIHSWIFNRQFSPKNIYFQISNHSRTEIIQTHPNKTIRIPLTIIQHLLDNLSSRKNPGTLFYKLILAYGDKHGLLTIPLRPIFEERLYVLPLDSTHRNDSYIDIDCSSTYVFSSWK